MKILLSPAKMLDYDQPIQTPFVTNALFLKEADYLVKKLQTLSKSQFKDLMNISEKLVDLNYERFQKWEQPLKINSDSQPAVTVFNGAVYKGLDVYSFSAKDFENAQDKIRILSGLYGILRPLDLMYPYRLEMGTKLKVNDQAENLYEYWGNRMTKLLNDEMTADDVVINLASNEYFKSIQKKSLKARVITPVFKELKGDKFKVVMMYAKYARGAMARDIIQNNYHSVEALKGYNVDGYTYSEKLSNAAEWVFVR